MTSKPFMWHLLVSIGICCASGCYASAAKVPAIRRGEALPKTTPWNLDELSRPPEFAWGDGTEVRSLYYSGQPYRGKPTRVFAYYATPGSLAGEPARDKDLPAIVLVHGGKGTALPDWARLWASRGYAAISMDLGSLGPLRQRIPDGGPRDRAREKFATGVPATDMWTYHAVADVIRAHSLVLSFREVDSTRTAMTGISWGGYLTCIVAGLDNRFKAAVPVYGCGFLHENSIWTKALGGMAAEDRKTWVQLWDPSMYVGSAGMPMLFVNGGTDFAYPPDSHAKTYALVKSPKRLHFVPDMIHTHLTDKPKAVELFIEHRLRGGVPLPVVGEPKVEERLVALPVVSETKLVKAELHYTADKLPGETNARRWQRQPATISGDTVTSGAPPEDATIWFLTVEDERGALVSSRLMFKKRHK